MLNHQTDLKIIMLRNQYRQLSQNQNLLESMWVGDTYYQFHQESLFEGKLTLYLPTLFTDMPDSLTRKRYPSTNRPQVIKTNEDNTVSITFSLIGESETPLTPKTIWKEIDRLFPRNVLYDIGSHKTESIEIFWLEYKSFSMESEVYNILFPIVFHGTGIVIGAFNCPFDSYDIWKPCILHIIRTIHDKGGYQ